VKVRDTAEIETPAASATSFAVVRRSAETVPSPLSFNRDSLPS